MNTAIKTSKTFMQQAKAPPEAAYNNPPQPFAGSTDGSTAEDNTQEGSGLGAQKFPASCLFQNYDPDDGFFQNLQTALTLDITPQRATRNKNISLAYMWDNPDYTHLAPEKKLKLDKKEAENRRAQILKDYPNLKNLSKILQCYLHINSEIHDHPGLYRSSSDCLNHSIDELDASLSAKGKSLSQKDKQDLREILSNIDHKELTKQLEALKTQYDTHVTSLSRQEFCATAARLCLALAILIAIAGGITLTLMGVGEILPLALITGGPLGFLGKTATFHGLGQYYFTSHPKQNQKGALEPIYKKFKAEPDHDAVLPKHEDPMTAFFGDLLACGDTYFIDRKCLVDMLCVLEKALPKGGLEKCSDILEKRTNGEN